VESVELVRYPGDYEIELKSDSRQRATPGTSAGAATAGWRAIAIAERIAAGIILVMVAPVLFIAGIVVAILSRRSPVVAHLRVGEYGRPIWILKLRTMWGDRDGGGFTLVERLPIAADIPERKPSDDPRVTSRFARICRRYSIDELPQLWQVVNGEMALVAPRPLTRNELDLYYGEDARELLTRKPGISGLWQVSGRSRLTYSQRRRLDLFMIRRWSFRLYLRILVVTVPKVLAGKDAW
jgi:lipopolysaccharide/colanic/teichoic acid biosynthesis glycosyltransferase